MQLFSLLKKPPAANNAGTGAPAGESKKRKFSDDAEPSSASLSIGNVTDAICELQHRMDEWLDPCGKQYEVESERVSTGHDHVATIRWTGFDRILAERLLELHAVDLGHFLVQDIRASLDAADLCVDVVKKSTKMHRVDPSEHRQPDAPEAGQASGVVSSLLFKNDEDDIRRWIKEDVDKVDMQNILLQLQQIKRYILIHRGAQSLSYDVKKRHGMYVVFIKGLGDISTDFIRSVKDGSSNNGNVSYWIDFESKVYVIEIVKNNLPL